MNAKYSPLVLVLLNILWLCDQANIASSNDTENGLSIEEQNANVIAHLLANQCNDENAQIIHNFFISNFHLDTVRSLYKGAIDKLIKQQDPEMIAAYVWHIYKPNEEKFIELMVELQVYLYEQLQQSNKQSDKYLTDVAYYIYILQSEGLMSNINSELKQQLTNVQSTLPKGLKEFYFASEFCMSNKHYKEYAYSSRFVEGQIRKIYTWLNAITSSSQYIWQKQVKHAAIGGESKVGRASFQVALKSESYGDFIFIDRERLNLVYGWVSSVPHADSFWKLEFINDALVFEHEGLFLCSTNVVDNENVRRTLHGYRDVQYTKDNPACQWVVEKCPFEKNIIGHFFGALFL